MVILSSLLFRLIHEVCRVNFVFHHVLSVVQQVVRVRRRKEVLLFELAHRVERIQFGYHSFLAEFQGGCSFRKERL